MISNLLFISTSKYELDEQAIKVPFNYHIKIEINKGNISYNNYFLNQKLEIYNKLITTK